MEVGNAENPVGFFELAEEIWAEADARREGFQAQHGEELGNFVADVRQYGAAWVGDVWEWTAIGAENHPAFATVPATHPWDLGPPLGSGWGAMPQYWGGWRKPHQEER